MAQFKRIEGVDRSTCGRVKWRKRVRLNGRKVSVERYARRRTGA